MDVYGHLWMAMDANEWVWMTVDVYRCLWIAIDGDVYIVSVIKYFICTLHEVPTAVHMFRGLVLPVARGGK